MKNNVFGLEEFRASDIVDHAAICMVAKRASGKSWIVRDILYFKRHYPAGMIIAPTDKMSGFYDSFFPSSYIHYEYSSDLLSQLFLRQETLIEKNRVRIAKGKKPVDTRVFLIMDDCLAQKSAWLKDQNIAELLQNGRHYHITFILTMQYSLGIPPEMRSNFDYVFLLGEDFTNNRKKLYDHYAGMFPTFDIFQQVFRNVTHDFGAMVLNNRKKSSEISEKVFWYKAATPPSNFLVGGRSFRSFHNEHYEKGWREANKKIFDINEFSRNGRHGPQISVELKKKGESDSKNKHD